MKVNNDAIVHFSKREIEILQHISDGHTSKEIGDILFISKQTVDKHRKNMLKKMNVKNCMALVRIYTDMIK